MCTRKDLSATVRIAIPANPGNSLKFSSLVGPHQAGQDGIEFQLGEGESKSNPLLMSIASAPVVLEQADNDQPEQAQKLQPPCEVAGQFFPQRDVDWYTFDAKADGLAPYRFSVVIENVREQNYFSEKLVDAVLCNTVPIYWGCPNIDRFIDPSALIICTSEDDIRQAINEASEDEFQSRLPALQALQPEVAAYGNIEERAAQAIRDDLNAY